MQTYITIIGIVAGLASITAFIYYLIDRKNYREKKLTYDLTHPVAIASILSDSSEKRLSLMYEDPGSKPTILKGAYLHFLRIGNLGKEPIKSDDIASSDPLIIQVNGNKVLDISCIGLTRSVNNFYLGSLLEENGVTSCKIFFDFLDFEDGALIRILSENESVKINIAGTIIGMPQGICLKDDIEKNTIKTGLGCIVYILLQLAAIAVAIYLFHLITGGWSLWVLLLPIVAFILPALIFILLTSIIQREKMRWPSSLYLPNWFVSEILRERNRTPTSSYGIGLTLGVGKKEIRKKVL